MRQMGFDSAFVHGNLEREVDVEFPRQVYTDDTQGEKVMRLRNILYGLREQTRGFKLLSSLVLIQGTNRP